MRVVGVLSPPRREVTTGRSAGDQGRSADAVL
jgi:hypothetical protein